MLAVGMCWLCLWILFSKPFLRCQRVARCLPRTLPGLCSGDSGGHGLPTGAVQLPLLRNVHGLSSGDQFLCTPNGLEAHHRIGHSFHCLVVLHKDVVEIFRFAKFDVQAKKLNEAIGTKGTGRTPRGGYGHRAAARYHARSNVLAQNRLRRRGLR